MKKVSIISILAFAILTVTSCDKHDLLGLIYTRSDNSDQRFAQSMDYNYKAGYKTVYVNSDQYKLDVISDVHMAAANPFFETFIDRYLADAEAADCILNLGDLTATKNGFGPFITAASPISAAGCTLFNIPGNHDIAFGLWDSFKANFGTGTYLFYIVTPSGKKDLYICLDSSNGTLGKDQRAWLEKTLSERRGIRHTIIATHTNFFNIKNIKQTSSSFNEEETYDLCALFANYGVKLVLSGHDHVWNETTYKNVRYIVTDALEYEEGKKEAYYTELNVGAQISPVRTRLN